MYYVKNNTRIYTLRLAWQPLLRQEKSRQQVGNKQRLPVEMAHAGWKDSVSICTKQTTDYRSVAKYSRSCSSSNIGGSSGSSDSCQTCFPSSLNVSDPHTDTHTVQTYIHLSIHLIIHSFIHTHSYIALDTRTIILMSAVDYRLYNGADCITAGTFYQMRSYMSWCSKKKITLFYLWINFIKWFYTVILISTHILKTKLHQTI